MTRPPFAEFSSLAIRELTDWIGGNAVWAVRLNDVLGEHFFPVADKVGLARENAWEALGEHVGPVFGIGLEDLCTRRFADPPSNVVDDFLKKRGFRLPSLAKAYLEALRDSVPGVYEAVAVQPGHGVTIRDLLMRGDPIDVIEVSGSRQIAQWDKLAARVVGHGGKRVFTGGVFTLAAESSKAVIDELRGMLQAVAGEAGVAAEAFRSEVANVMREAAPMLGGLRIAQILESLHHPLPKLVNRDGDPYEFVEARYPLASRARTDAITRLDTEPALRRTGARPAKWAWVAKSSEHPSRASSAGEGYALDTHPDGDTERVVLANVAVSGKKLELSVNSRRRLESARAFIEPLLAGLTGEAEVTIKSVEDTMAENRDMPKPPRRPVPKRVERAVMQRYLDGYYRNWMDEKIPALDGSSPHEAARHAAGADTTDHRES